MFGHSSKFCPQTIINAPVSSVLMCPLTSAARILHAANTALFAEGNTSPFSTDTASVAFSTGLLKGSNYSKKTPKAICLITHPRFFESFLTWAPHTQKKSFLNHNCVRYLHERDKWGKLKWFRKSGQWLPLSWQDAYRIFALLLIEHSSLARWRTPTKSQMRLDKNKRGKESVLNCKTTVYKRTVLSEQWMKSLYRAA